MFKAVVYWLIMEQEQKSDETQQTNKPANSLKKLGIVAAVFGLLVGITIVLNSGKTKAPSIDSSRAITQAELQKADGKEGRDCWVAVDGKIYDLSNSLNWENGEHATSEGQARCGADMSSVIDKSPHGRKMLDQLDVVGTLATL
jgi:predicted heme/steroid binding protein